MPQNPGPSAPEPDADGLTDLTDLSQEPGDPAAKGNPPSPQQPFGGPGAPPPAPVPGSPPPPDTPHVIPASPPAQQGFIPPTPAQQSSRRAAPAAPPPAGPPPGLMDAMESTLRVPFQADCVFTAVRATSPPDLASMLLNILMWTLIGQLLLLVMAFMTHPAAAGLGILPTIAVIVVGLILAVPLSFIGAGLLHALARCSGGKDGFARSYQLMSLLGAVAPLSAVIVFLPVPLIWIVPTLYLSYLCVRGVSILHDAPDGQSWLVIGLLGGGLAAAQFVFHTSIERYHREASTRITLYRNQGNETGGSLSSGVENASAAAMPALPRRRIASPSGMPGISVSGDGARGRRAIAADGTGWQGSAGVTGGMSMIRGAGGRAAAGPASVFPESGPSDDQMQAMSMNILDMVNQQLRDNPDTINNLPPEQRAKFRQILKTANQQRTHAEKTRGKPHPMSRQQTQDMIQRMMRQYMGSSRGRKKASRRKRRRRAPPPDDDFGLGDDDPGAQ